MQERDDSIVLVRSILYAALMISKITHQACLLGSSRRVSLTTLLLLYLLFTHTPVLRAQDRVADFLRTQGHCETTTALLSIHHVGDKLYCEIPDSILSKDIIITHTLLRAPALKQRNPNKKTGYSGDLFGPVVIRLKKVSDRIHVYLPLYDRVTEGGLPQSPLHQIAHQRGNEALLKTLPILVHGDCTSLIDATTLVKNHPYLNLSSLSLELGLGAMLDFHLYDLSGDAETLMFKSIQSYTASAMFAKDPAQDSHTIKTWDVGTCLRLLPDQPIDLIKQHQRTYFYISKKDFDTDPYQASKTYYLKRWRLAPKPEDMQRYERGEVVPPSQPIVFYIDSNLPSRWLPYVIEAVEAWRPAFERAGFREAIHARPITAETPFDISDSRHPYISWKISPQKNAYGPHPNEPRSGEILCSHVSIFSSVVDMLSDWYFVQCGASDPQARAIDLPDSIMGALIKMVVTHEIGHTLGLEHNFFGSSIASIDQLRDNAYLSQHGLTSSVMDYVRCNYALRPQDTVDLANRISRIGAYDLHIIEQGYRLFPGKTPQERQAKRQEWLHALPPQLDHVFVSGRDYRALAEDLGNDHIAINRQGIENMKYLSALQDLWIPTDTHTTRVLHGRTKAMTQALKQWVLHLSEHIGGRLDTDLSDQVSHLQPLSPTAMRAATDFVLHYGVTPQMWLFDPVRLQPIGIDHIHEGTTYYEEVIPALLSRLEYLESIPQATTETYTCREYLDALHATVFKDWDLQAISPDDQSLREPLQSIYVRSLTHLLDTSKSARIRLEVWKSLRTIVHQGSALLPSLTPERQQHILQVIHHTGLFTS